MSLKAVHRDNGFLTLHTESGPIHIDTTGSQTPPICEPDAGHQPLQEIVFGPLPPPPLPMGVVVVGGPRRRPGSYQMRLDEAVRNGRFSREASEAIARIARSKGGSDPL